MNTIYIHMKSTLLEEALSALLEPAGFQVVTDIEDIDQAELALVDLRSVNAPIPEDLQSCPALALINGSEPDKLYLLKAGYRGYLGEQAGLKELQRAAEVVLGGEVWAERAILSQLIQRRKPKLQLLTNREEEVLKLVSRGLTNRQIGQQLGISEKTVKVYVSALLSKLEATNRLELMRRYGQAPVPK